MTKLLIVDDEANVLSSLRKRLRNDSLQVLTAETGRAGIELVREQSPAAVLLDVRLPDMSGLDAFDEIHQIAPRTPVVVFTAYSTTEMAIDAMKRGAFEFLLKPVDFQQLKQVIARALEVNRLRHVPAMFGDPQPDTAGDWIIGRSPAMQEVYKSIGRVAQEQLNVLILGESGTGKELVARAIYDHSHRRDQMFLAINCAALPETLLESELFGHERGAFTGADRRRMGKFEQAHRGTIFLDELGDMSLATQAKMLRLLQDGSFERVGGNETLLADVRVLAATNQDLEQKIATGEFRQDLYFRLNGFTITLPPLRQRREDLPALIEHLLRVLPQQAGQPRARMAPETMRLLEQYEWPGNVRELQSVIRYALVHAVGQVIMPECLPESCRGSGASTPTITADAERVLSIVVRRLLREAPGAVYERVFADVERVLLYEALQHVGGNQVQASEQLGISRTTLRARLKQFEQAE